MKRQGEQYNGERDDSKRPSKRERHRPAKKLRAEKAWKEKA
ncbi:hypothetical protein [Clostridium sp. Marseille-P3244]|nr:hypothetical protein [Clostridium sp. Marseille-P3244]